MDEQNAEFSARASLVAFGVRFQRMGIWAEVSARVKIKQKERDHTPPEKLLDCLITILAGGAGVVETNTLVRPDEVVQRAFGRDCCAEQSTISRTLTACQVQNVTQMREAVSHILRQHARSYQHNYTQGELLLDVDMTGMPAGRQGEGSTKGYFAKRKNCRGRQLGRVLATDYDETIVDCLYDGKRQLNRALPELISHTARAFTLDAAKRRATIVRIDGGAGDDLNINWMLEQGYHLLIKLTSWRRAQSLSAQVHDWFVDSKIADRSVGWVEQPIEFARPTRQLLVRTPKKNGTWSYSVLVLTLSDAMTFRLANRELLLAPTLEEQALAALHAYDRRGGGLETQNKGDKQGLALTHRNKRKFVAQEMLVLLAQLAHNFVIWARNDLAEADPRLGKFGIQRTVRDALQIPGSVMLSESGQIEQITLNGRHPLAAAVKTAFAGDELSLYLRKN
jgi:Transposase DDE domain group 1